MPWRAETWSEPWYDTELIEPICSAGLINTGSGDTDTLYFSNPDSTNSRTRMLVRRSDTSGASWSTAAQSELVWPGSAAYSTLVELGNSGTARDKNTVGLFFENGDDGREGPLAPYQRISFANVTHWV